MIAGWLVVAFFAVLGLVLGLTMGFWSMFGGAVLCAILWFATFAFISGTLNPRKW